MMISGYFSSEMTQRGKIPSNESLLLLLGIFIHIPL